MDGTIEGHIRSYKLVFGWGMIFFRLMVVFRAFSAWGIGLPIDHRASPCAVVWRAFSAKISTRLDFLVCLLWFKKKMDGTIEGHIRSYKLVFGWGMIFFSIDGGISRFQRLGYRSAYRSQGFTLCCGVARFQR